MVALTFVVGRVAEARIFFPLSGVLGFVAAHVWTESRMAEHRSNDVDSQS